MDWKWQIVAALAMIMIEASYVPQIMRLYRTKKAKDFSIFFPLMNAGGRCLGLLYTGLNGDIVLAVGFLAGILLRLTLLFQVWHYKRSENIAADGTYTVDRLPVWVRLRSWYDANVGRGPRPAIHSYQLTRLMAPPNASELLLKPALCHVDSCQPQQCSPTNQDS